MDKSVEMKKVIDNSNYKAQVKFIDRKRKFDKQFEDTLVNFSINMDFLNK